MRSRAKAPRRNVNSLALRAFAASWRDNFFFVSFVNFVVEHPTI